MLDPKSLAPVSAQYATAHAPEWNVQVGKRTYETQAEANAGSIAANLADAAKAIREAAADPDLWGSQQFTEELDNRIAYLHGVAEILAGRGVDRRARLMRQGALGDVEREAMALIERVDAPLDLAEKVTALREAMALLGPRPEPEPDPEQVAMLAWIKREVAPRRDDESLLPMLMPKTGTLAGDVATIMALDEGGEDEAPQLADFVSGAPGDKDEGAADA